MKLTQAAEIKVPRIVRQTPRAMARRLAALDSRVLCENDPTEVAAGDMDDARKLVDKG